MFANPLYQILKRRFKTGEEAIKGGKRPIELIPVQGSDTTMMT